MRLSIKALAIAGAILWGACVLFVGLVNLAVPSYGAGFLAGVASIYPGYHASRTIGDLLAGTGYALVDGAAGGVCFGWLYNRFTRPAA